MGVLPLELYQLRYFKTIAETEHFTRAAEVLHVAQPSLSKAISNLEAELGVQLFDRGKRSVYLNDYGRAFLRRVEHILTELEEAINHQAQKGYRLHTITTSNGGSKGLMGGDRIQATMVFEKVI